MPAHPALAPVVVRRPPQGERTWQGTENALAALREAGLDDATAAATYQGLLNYTLGHAALEAPYALMRSTSMVGGCAAHQQDQSEHLLED